MSLLELRDLHVEIGDAHILRGVSLKVDAGETLGVVGESGCGKTMTGLAVMGMLPRGAVVSQGSIDFDGRDLTKIRPREWLDIRGQSISLVMQDPFTSLNPMMRIGDQIAEVYQLHLGLSRRESWTRAVEMVRKVGVASPASSAKRYPHQMSGGQRQRIVIAIAFASRPKLLIADEPTTALDVTLQAQILHLLRDLQREVGTAVIVISHDIGVIGTLADRIAVYYAGRVVETGSASDVLKSPLHPYTKALMAAMPTAGANRLIAIGGQPPRLTELPVGCSFAPRCQQRFEKCNQDPALFNIVGERATACWLSAPND